MPITQRFGDVEKVYTLDDVRLRQKLNINRVQESFEAMHKDVPKNSALFYITHLKHENLFYTLISQRFIF